LFLSIKAEEEALEIMRRALDSAFRQSLREGRSRMPNCQVNTLFGQRAAVVKSLSPTKKEEPNVKKEEGKDTPKKDEGKELPKLDEGRELPREFLE